MNPVVSGENKRKHLEFIQGVITRTASNLFFLKGWAITLIAAIFALAAKDTNPKYFGLAFGVTLILWALDAYFLRQERLFRCLYNHVRTLDEKHIDFSLSTAPFIKESRNKWYRSAFSTTLVIFYAPLLLLMVVIMEFVK